MNKHIQNEECAEMQEGVLMCPLCKALFTIDNKENQAWRNHLLKEGCLNNPRTN